MADPDTDAKPVDQETLVADIDRTRAELARTIDAISDRVSPRKNVQRARTGSASGSARSIPSWPVRPRPRSSSA